MNNTISAVVSVGTITQWENLHKLHRQVDVQELRTIETWRAYGQAMVELRDQCPGDREFGQALKAHGIELHPNTRAAYIKIGRLSEEEYQKRLIDRPNTYTVRGLLAPPKKKTPPLSRPVGIADEAGAIPTLGIADEADEPEGETIEGDYQVVPPTATPETKAGPVETILTQAILEAIIAESVQVEPRVIHAYLDEDLMKDVGEFLSNPGTGDPSLDRRWKEAIEHGGLRPTSQTESLDGTPETSSARERIARRTARRLSGGA